MENNSVMPWSLVILNAAILLVVAWCVWYNYKKSHSAKVLGYEYGYHLILFSKVTFFGFANIGAMLFNYYLFFVLKVEVPEGWGFVRWMDRVFMLINALYEVLNSKKPLLIWMMNTLGKLKTENLKPA